MSSKKILGPTVTIYALLMVDLMCEGIKNTGKNQKNSGGTTSLQELMKHSMININAKNHADHCISCSDTGAFVSNF